MDAIFFPRQDYPVQICPHRYGKKMAYTEQSDQLRLSTVVGDVNFFDWIMGLVVPRGIKVGFFARYDDLYHTDFAKVKTLLDAGKLWLDEYSWSPELSSKISGGQTITAEEFLQSYENTLLPPFLNVLAKKPVCLSYSYGNQTFKDSVCPTYLGARNSGYGLAGTDYGVGFGNPNNVPYSFENYKSKSSTYRWYDNAKIDSSFDAKLAIVSTKIDETMQNGGWFSNFTHFDDMLNDGNEQYAEAYYDLLEAKNQNDEIWFAGYGEAVAYLVFRQLITRAVMYSPISSASNKLIIRLEAENTIGVDADLLQVPISVKFSTAGTPLEGKTITSSRNIISLGNNEYIVEIPYSRFPVAEIVSE